MFRKGVIVQHMAGISFKQTKSRNGCCCLNLLGFCLDALAFKKVPVVRIVRSTLEIHSFPCSCLVPVVHYCCQGQPKKTYRTRKRGLQCCCLKSNVEQRCSKGTCKQTYCARMCHTWCAWANGLLVVYYISLVVGGLVTRERTSS
jgi:hypothetical protein